MFIGLLAVLPAPLAGAGAFGPSAPLSSRAATDPWWQSDDDVTVATDGKGTWLAVWSSLTYLGVGVEPDTREVFLSRSTDGGVTWSEMEHLQTPTGPVAAGHPELATDGAGTWVVVGHACVGEDLDVVFSRSTDKGKTWTTPKPVNGDAAIDSSRWWDSDHDPQVVSDGSGGWVVVWESSRLDRGADILYARSTDAGQTWVEATLDADSDSVAWEPQLATDFAGTLVAVWTRGRVGERLQGEVVFSRSVDHGSTWTAPVELNTGVAGGRYSTGPVVETDGAGNWIAFWSAFRLDRGDSLNDSDILYSRSSDGGVNWSSPQVVSGELGTSNWGPEVTTDGDIWMVIWGSRNDLGGTIGDDGDLLVSRSTDTGGTWTAPEALDPNASNNSGQDSDPVLVTDGAGRWVAAWSSSDDAGGTIGQDFDVVFSRAPVLCPAVSTRQCVEGFAKGFLVSKETRAGRERVDVRMRKGPVLNQADFGDPLTALGTAYAVCIYDGSDSLVVSLEVDRAGAACGTRQPCWRAVRENGKYGHGYLYEDKRALARGVTKLLVTGRRAGRSQASVHARNHASRGRTALPTGISSALAEHGSVTVQVVTSDAECLSMELSEIVRNESDYFKARR